MRNELILFNGGQNIAVPEEELTKGEVALSLNLSVNQKPGYLVKRPDSEIVKYGDYSPKGFGENITYFKFYKRNGDKYDLTLYDWYPGDPPQVNGKCNILKWIKQPVSGGDSIQGYIWPFFSTLGQSIQGLSFGNRLLLTNGVDLMMFFEDEDSYGKLEITNVETAPSGVITEWLEAADTPILSATLIQYKVSYYFDDDQNKQSNTSSASELVDGQYMFNEFGIKKIKVTIPVSLNTRVSGRIIYRRYKLSDGYADNNFSSPWQKIKVIENNIDTEYVDIIPSNGGVALPESVDTVPIAKCMEEINNRVFYGNVIEPAEEAGVGFAYSQIFTVTQSEGKTLTNVIVPITLQWHNPGADNYIKYGDFVEVNEGKDIKFMLNDTGVVTPLGFMLVEFRGEDWEEEGIAEEVDFKIRMPELKTATGQEIVIFYGKDGMAFLSNWQDLYRKELLYSDMIALFHMDKFKESTKVYNRKSDNHGTINGVIADFIDGDGGIFGGVQNQYFTTGKRVQLTDNPENGYIDFGNLGLSAAEENGAIALWFKIDTNAPDPSDTNIYSILRYKNGGEAGLVVLGLRCILIADAETYQIGVRKPEGITVWENISNPWDGNWHQVMLSWEKLNGTSKWYVYLDG